MSNITIITNNIPRQIIYGYELTDAEKADFDYIEDIDSHDFFRYKGHLYDPSDMMSCDSPHNPFPAEWQAYVSNSFFDGILVRWTDDFESVIVGRYFS